MTTLVPPELIDSLAASDVSNDSGVAGANVDDALNTLDGASDLGDQGSSIASAATTDIGNADSSFVFITGTTTITSFGTTVTRNHMWLKFAAGLTLTQNATSLILPTGANITTQADDRCEAIRLSSGAGNWIIINYQRADGTSLVGGGGGGYTLETPQATTSGTAKDFTGLPSGLIQIVATFSGTSLSGTDDIIVQIGDSGGFETSGYVSTSSRITASVSTFTSTAGFLIRVSTAGDEVHGALVLTLIDSSTNTWEASSACMRNNTTVTVVSAGGKSLSGELTQVRITRDGSNTFDAGKVNIAHI